MTHNPRMVAFMLLTSLAACSNKSKTEQAAAPVQGARAVSVTRVQSRALGGSFVASGLLVPLEEAAVNSELSGYRVADVFVDEGDLVRAGQPLARLDPTLIEAKILQARAQVVQSQAKATQAQGEANRVRGLDGTGVLADEQIATRRGDAASAEAAIDVSRAQLKDLLTQRAQMVIRAPVSGIVLQRTIRPGAVAAPGGDPMFRIARDRRIELDAEVPEDALATIRPGTDTQVSLPSGVRLDGTVRFVSPRVDSQTKLGRARISLPVNPQLRSGGFARAEFQRMARTVAAVPEAAVQFEASGPLLVVLDGGNHAHRVPVRTGVRAGGWVELLHGPAAGTRVAMGGGAFLLEGDPVRPIDRALAGGN
ncbi:efflux RND transporter periplasmic adaptor subunit [Sphingomonas sp. NFX23]|uniref:efflux RND transporter periplasmic adaptor subunit n=1 Tax=Sphingomonas sp. NFX23 TaxID=2819532 RepID=UPI003CEBEC4D